ncbi:MAG: dienelactone hydrolase family protein [Hyphomicrobiales bacterium]
MTLASAVTAVTFMALAFLTDGQATAASDLVEEHGYFRVVIGGHQARLEGLVVKRADVQGRLPIALIVHGQPIDFVSMAGEHTDAVARQARDLAARGWLAVAPMHRGFGQSDGPHPGPVTCEQGSLMRRFLGNADELEAVLDLIGQRPDADPSRIIAIGVSAGGADVASLASRNLKGLLGVVSVSGGLRFESCPSWQDNLVTAFGTLGATSKVPELWIYARNDSFFGPDLVERMRGAALDGGADVKLVMFDPVGDDGHRLFGSAVGRAEWLRELDTFLRFLKLPTWQLADVDALLVRLKAQVKSKTFLESYFADPREKALVYSRNGNSFSDGFGSSTLEAARAVAVKGCSAKWTDCAVVMEDDGFVGEAQ